MRVVASFDLVRLRGEVEVAPVEELLWYYPTHVILLMRVSSWPGFTFRVIRGVSADQLDDRVFSNALPWLVCLCVYIDRDSGRFLGMKPFIMRIALHESGVSLVHGHRAGQLLRPRISNALLFLL